MRCIPSSAVVALFVTALTAAPPAEANDGRFGVEIFGVDPLNDVQLWGLVMAEGQMIGPVSYYLEVQPRASLLGGAPHIALLRPAVGFYFTKWMSVWAGAAWIPKSSPDAWFSAGEGRLFQQLIFSKSFGPVGLMSRSRFEQRAIEGVSGVAFRVRSLLRGSLGLFWENRVYAVVWDELFANANTVPGGPRRGFDQNRAFLGMGVRPWPFVAFEAGYLNRIGAGRPLPTDHALLTVANLRF